MTDDNSTPKKKKIIYHGMINSPEYRTWAAMKERCYNPKCINYAYYGDRGIRVCDRWLDDFPAFYQDMGEKPSKTHSIDRINSNGNYEPSNCRWATILEQRRNRSGRHFLTYNGETLMISEWEERMGFNKGTLLARVNTYGMSVGDALTRPVRSHKRKAV